VKYFQIIDVDPFFIPIQIDAPAEKIAYRHKILLTGSCFTEHIGTHLQEMKFDTLQNPNGILFDPLSVAQSLISYLEPESYSSNDLFFHDELWQSWKHHGQFSDTIRENTLSKINSAQQAAHVFLKQADWLIITLGSAFVYILKDQNKNVANCHRAPANWFTKKLVSIEEMLAVLDEAMHRLLDFNPKLQVVFTVSPVRHIRDGVIENNRSKARLIEVVHQLVNKFNRTYYFPAYELVIDVLRDYRFYDKDLVHPNYLATKYVLENFMEYYVQPESRSLAEEIRKLQISVKHRPLHPETKAHRRFLEEQYAKTLDLAGKYPFIDFNLELLHFSGKDG
jgi:hypothetical protein